MIFARFFLSILFFLILFTYVVQASTYIVAKDGSGDFTSIQACVSTVAGPGVVCSVKPGNYTEQVQITKAHSGNAVSGHFVIQNHTSKRPTLNGRFVETGPNGLIEAIGASYIKIVGLEITGYEGIGIFVRNGSAQHIEIRNNEIHHNRWTRHTRNAIKVHGQWPRFGGPFEITDVIVDGNYIHHVTTTIVNSTRGNEALTMAAHVERCQITNNTIDTANNIGIDLIGSDKSGSLPDRLSKTF